MDAKKKDTRAGATLGETLQQLREGKHLSQAELARLAKVNVNSLRNWEQDRCIPRLDHADRLARFLEVSLDELARTLVHKPSKKRR